jgi:hypothetical protein
MPAYDHFDRVGTVIAAAEERDFFLPPPVRGENHVLRTYAIRQFMVEYRAARVIKGLVSRTQYRSRPLSHSCNSFGGSFVNVYSQHSS